MKMWLVVLSLILSLSLGLNFYLLTTTHIDDSSPTAERSAHQARSGPAFGDEPETNGARQVPAQEELAESVASSYTELGAEQHTLFENRSNLLEFAQGLYAKQNWLELNPLLQAYLKQHPQDMDFLLLEAKVKVETSLLSDAIAHYFDLLRNPMTAEQKSEIESQIKLLSANSIEQLARNYSWDVLAMFVEPLLQLDPSNRLYILSLAKAYAELYQEALMENVLASLPYDDPDAEAVRQIIAAQQSQDDSDELRDLDDTPVSAGLGRAIQLKKYGDQYVVEGVLSGNPVALLIDTGASVTAISRQYYDKLSNRYKVNYLGRFSIGTAAGTIMAGMYQFRELTIGHVTVESLPVVILPMGDFDTADGLLGMNFLREFDFKLDQKEGVIYIK